MVNHLGSGLRFAYKVALLLLWVAPDTARVPVPCLYHQLGILPIGYGLPSCAENFLENRVGQQMVRRSSFQSINRRTQRADGTECVNNVRRRGIDDDRLSGCRDGCPRTCDPKKKRRSNTDFNPSALHA